MTHFLGIDFGTSGCRGVVLREDGERLAEAAVPLPPSQHNGAAVEQSPAQWWQALEALRSRRYDCVVLDLGEVIARGRPRDAFDDPRVQAAYFEGADA